MLGILGILITIRERELKNDFNLDLKFRFKKILSDFSSKIY